MRNEIEIRMAGSLKRDPLGAVFDEVWIGGRTPAL
jgi:hypothetical protein